MRTSLRIVGSMALAACGEVTGPGPDVTALEDRIAALEARVAELSTPALHGFDQLSCVPGQTIGWDGTRWGCADAYSDGKAVAAVGATDAYVTKVGDSTITGNLTVTGATVTDGLDVVGGAATFAGNEMKFFRVAFLRTGTKIQLINGGVLLSELDLGDGTQNLQNSMIAYRAGTTGSDAKLLFNIEATPSLRCTLLHHDDDTPQPGFYFATDSGNTALATSVWGNATTATFVIARQGAATHVINSSSQYQIACF